MFRKIPAIRFSPRMALAVRDVHLDSWDWKDLRVGAEATSSGRLLWLTMVRRKQENIL